MVPADLLDAASLGAAAARLLDHWGAPDVVVHNGRYIGPGHMDRFLDTPIELLEKQIWGNVLAPLTLNKLLLPDDDRAWWRDDRQHHVRVGVRGRDHARR